MIYRPIPSRTSCLRAAGFTVIEVVAVLAVLAILAAIVVSRITSTSAIKLAPELEIVKTHLRYAQTRAMNTDSRWGVYFETSNSYWLFKGDTPESGKANLVALPGEANTVTLPTLTINSTPLTVAFDGFGSPGTTSITIGTSGGSIVIAANTGFIQ